MEPLTEPRIRTSFRNASKKECSDLNLPATFEDVAWGQLDIFGWRDPKYQGRAYVMVPRLDGSLSGILLKQAEVAPRKRALCAWCQDVRLPHEVVFYSAKRPRSPKRDYATVGTLMCQEFQCSANVRNDPPAPYEGFDADLARQQRIDSLILRAEAFAADLVT